MMKKREWQMVQDFYRHRYNWKFIFLSVSTLQFAYGLRCCCYKYVDYFVFIY